MFFSHQSTEIPYQKTPKSNANTCKNQSVDCVFKTGESDFLIAKQSQKTERALLIQDTWASLPPLPNITKEYISKNHIPPNYSPPLFIIHNALLL